MKKYLLYFIILLLVILLFPIIIRKFHKAHTISYKINDYLVEEDFFIQEKEHFYRFVLNQNEDTYIFYMNDSFSNKKKILSNILEYHEGDISCIVPVTKNKKQSSLYCLKNHQQVSNDLLVDDENYTKLLENINDYSLERDNSFVEYDQLKVYSHNILEDEIYYIWNYKGIYVLQKDDVSYQKIIDIDLYDNIMATTVGPYYVLFLNNSVSGIDTYYYYDPIHKKVFTVHLDIKLEKDSYINGVKDSIIYVTDKRKKKQYAINIFKESIELVGNEEDLYITYQNDEKVLYNKSDFFMNHQYFSNNHVSFQQYNDCIYDLKYYYCHYDNMFIRMDSKTHSSHLFLLDDITEWKIMNHQLLLLKDDILYSYSDTYGFRSILEYRELNYNYANIYQLGKK